MPTQDSVLLETDDSLKEWFEKEIEIKRKVYKEWLKKKEKKEKEIKEINFNSDTKEMSIVYSDGSIKKYIGAEVATTAQTDLGKGGQLEITYNFKDFNNDGKYVEDFGENNE